MRRTRPGAAFERLGKTCVAAAIVLLVLALAFAARQVRPVSPQAARLGQPAPEWDVTEWINGDPGPLARMRGQVVVIEFFQILCKGCNAFGLPLMRRLEEEYAGRDDIRFVMIHSVFAHHDRQTPETLRAFIGERGIRTSVGVDRHARGRSSPETMNRYRLAGTPVIAVIDKQGILRFRRLGRFDPDRVRRYIDRCLDETD